MRAESPAVRKYVAFFINPSLPEARNRSLREIRKAFAFMYAGDNHLPTVAHHGVDEWEHAGVSFTVPSIAAGYPRAWWPGKAGLKPADAMPSYTEGLPGKTRDYVGRYREGWGHRLTMLAAANPEAFKGSSQTPAGDIKTNGDKTIHIVKWHMAPRDLREEESMSYYPEHHGFDVNIGGSPGELLLSIF